MTHLTFQEVTEPGSKNDTRTKDGRIPIARVEDQPHRPEFYIPRITRRLAALVISTWGSAQD